MKAQLEQLSQPINSSLKIMVNPNLSDMFYWHFHPEIELVYIWGANGTRHVGQHLSQFSGSDLVLIGSDIPHLNFDYGIKQPYQKRVFHLTPGFLGVTRTALPELQSIERLMKDADYGLAFGKQTQKKLHKQLSKLHQSTGFDKFLKWLQILSALAEAQDVKRLHPQPYHHDFRPKDRERLASLNKFIEENYHRKIQLSEAAALTFFTEVSFCRYFRKMTKLSFVEYLNQFRIEKAKKMLMQNKSVSDTATDCGFESLSYFNRTFKKITGQNPSRFKNQFEQSEK